MQSDANVPQETVTIYNRKDELLAWVVAKVLLCPEISFPSYAY